LSALVFAIGGCGHRESEESAKRCGQAMKAAAADLLCMGFVEKSVELMEEAYHTFPTPEEAENIAFLYEKNVGCSAAVKCMERLLGSRLSPGMTEALIERYIDGWQWEKARTLLDRCGSDPRLAEVNDILGCFRSIGEPFGKHRSLSWQAEGMSAEDSNGRVFLRSLGEKGPAFKSSGFYTYVGWDGNGFRLCAELCFTRLIRAGLLWGLSSRHGHGLARAPDHDPSRPKKSDVFVSYRNGRISLLCGGDTLSSPSRMSREFYLPMGRWLRVNIEYLPYNSVLQPDSDEKTGRIRLWVQEIENKRCLLDIETSYPFVFEKGRVAAGLFSAAGYPWKTGEIELYIDNFTFDN